MDISSTLWEVGGPRIRGTQQSSGGVIGAKDEMDDLDGQSTVQRYSTSWIHGPPLVCTFGNGELGN